MERLISTNEQSGSSLGIEDRAHSFCNLLRPITCSTLRGYPQMEVLRGYKHAVCIVETALRDTINPHYKRLPVFFECCTRLRGWTNKVCDCETTSPDHLIAKPTHSTSVLDSIWFGKA